MENSQTTFPQSLISALQNDGRSFHQTPGVPDKLEDLLEAVKNPKGHEERNKSEEITPLPCFVVKSAEDSGQKVFLNFCGSEKVPGWGTDYKKVQLALKDYGVDSLDDEQVEALRIPISVGEKNLDVDKQGNPCLVVDCILNLDVAKQSKSFRNLKTFLIDIVFEWVEQKHDLKLDRKYKLPKLKYKGSHVRSQRIRINKKPVVQDVKEVPDAPSFPLIANKAKQIESTSPSQSVLASTVHPQDSKNKKMLDYKIEFEGKPAHCIVVTVLVPSAAELNEESIKVEVCAFEIHVTMPGYHVLTVEMPFAVTETLSECIFLQEQNILLIRLAHYPLEDLLRKMRRDAPHGFGTLNLKSELLKLEEF